MSKRRNLPEPGRRGPRRAADAGRHRQPPQSATGLIVARGRVGAKLLAVGALGSAAMMAIPASTAPNADAAPVTPQTANAHLAASVNQGLTPIFGGLLYVGPPSTGTSLSGLSGLFGLPKATPGPSSGNTADVSSAAAAIGANFSEPPAFLSALPPTMIPDIPVSLIGPVQPAGGFPLSTPTDGSQPNTTQNPLFALSYYVNYVNPLMFPVGFTASYTTDPTGQTGGFVAAGPLVGEGINAGVRAVPPVTNPYNLTMPVTVMDGPITLTATPDVFGNTTYSASYDLGKANPFGPGTTVGESLGVTYTQSSDGSTSLLPRASIWGSANPQMTVGLAAQFPLDGGFLAQVSKAISDSGYLEMGLIPPDSSDTPGASTPGVSVPTLDQSTLQQMMTTQVSPSQGFPDPASVDPNSGAAWAAQQPSLSGPSFQGIINSYSQAPNNSPAPADPSGPAAPAPEQHGQADPPPADNTIQTAAGTGTGTGSSVQLAGGDQQDGSGQQDGAGQQVAMSAVPDPNASYNTLAG